MDSSLLTEIAEEETDLAPLDPRAVEIYCWRVEQLERAGYSGGFAHILAENNYIDLHLACDLITRGCPEQTAYAILV
jgi:hypothetical protein